VKAATICNVAGCGEMVERGKCRLHEREARAKRPRNPFYSTAGWDRIRRAYLKLHPVCEHCFKEAATDVHHVDEDTHNNLDDNLEGLCKGCHAKITLHPFKKSRTVRSADRTHSPRVSVRGPDGRKPVVGGGLLEAMREDGRLKS
jgi:5-methylcytosine-specific restriction protein A